MPDDQDDQQTADDESATQSASDRLTCWYDYKCPLPNRDLVLTKRECKMMAPIILGPLS